VSKRVLIVSPHFPPVNAPDLQRIRVALPYFVAAGWDVTVLTVADPTPTAPLEPELEATVPAAVRVVRAHCCSRRWTGLLGVNNVALRSLPFLFLAGCRLLGGRRYDAVYFSTTMFIVLPLGRLWKLLSGVPYVIDLQDPWVTDYYERPGSPPPPGGWKYRFAQGLGRVLEGWTMRGAAGLLAVSSAYLDTLRRRYPNLHATPAAELPFGSPDPDLAHLRATRAQRPALLPAGGVRLAFAGALGPGQLAAVEVLFAGLAEARRAGAHLTVHFFGTSYDPAARPVTLALAALYGLQDRVHEQPGRLRYFDALQITLEAGANLLLGSTDLAFTPSKILAVLAAGRPVLALAPAGSAMIARLTELGQDCVAFPAGKPEPTSVRAIADWLQSLAAGRVAPPAPAALSRFDARTVAARQLAILSAAT
jgi:glycosyltransferase involved in cell wall biosynthesis